MLRTLMKPIRSAGCLIIGDEVLNGKILDTNSHVFSKFCFNDLSIPVKKTVVCGDDRQDIINSLRYLINDNCDFIVTSGGIGPTHDDITYELISEAYGLACELDKETVSRMHSLRKQYVESLSARKLDAFYKMATFPVASTETKVEKIYTDSSLWVPIVGVDSRVYILPGVPQLFEKLLLSLKETVKPRIDPSLLLKRFYVKTLTKESNLAPFLTDLQQKCDDSYGVGAVKLGSYPHFAWGVNTISIIGNQSVAEADLREVVELVVKNIEGDAVEITGDEEERMTTESPDSSS